MVQAHRALGIIEIFMINDLVGAFHVSYNTVSSKVDVLLKMRIVTQDKEQYRNRIFKAQHFTDIFADYI